MHNIKHKLVNFQDKFFFHLFRTLREGIITNTGYRFLSSEILGTNLDQYDQYDLDCLDFTKREVWNDGFNDRKRC